METRDELDRQIIELLAKDSRASFRKMAKEIGLSVDTITRRFKKLKNDNVIQATIIVNLEKLGYEGFVFFGLKVESQKVLRQITEKVAKVPDVTAVMETAGDYDLTIIVAVKSIKHTFKVGEEISNIAGVRRVMIDHFQLSKTKELIYPPPPWHNLDIGSN